MALAETAQLAVRLSMDASQFQKTVSGMESRLSRFGGAARRTGKVIGYGIAAGITAGVAVLGVNLKKGLEALKQDAIVAAQTEAVIKSTGGAAGISADQVAALADQLSRLNGVQDDVVQQTTNLLLTFKGISGKDGALQEATQAALDMSAALGQDTKSSAIQLGKALNDPIKGITALRRVGVQLTEQQEQQIKLLVKEGKLREAQAIILGEVRSEFEGVAKAQADADPGRRLQLSVERLQKALARNLLPVVQKVQERLTEFFDKPETIAAVQRVGDAIAALFTDENLSTAASAIETAAKAVGVALDAFNQLPPEVKALAIGAFAINKVTGGAVSGLAKGLASALGQGLRQIFAAHVTVVGGSVTGAGLPGAAGAGAGAAGATGATAPAAAAAGGVLAPGAAPLVVGAALPFAMFYGLPSIVNALNPDRTPGFEGNKFEGAFGSSDAPTTSALERQIGSLLTGAMAKTEKNTADTTGAVRDSNALLRSAEGAAREFGALEKDLNQRQIDKLDNANVRLERIARKPTRFTANTSVTVSTAVSVRDQAARARSYVNVARRTGLYVDP